MTEAYPKSHAKLADAIGHDFASDSALLYALTHPSFTGSDNPRAPQIFERLEFLGDRVLGLVVAEMLYHAFPASSEGGLASRFNQMVRKETCADVAREIDLGSYILMSPGESDAGGRDKRAILGNACEALIAAIYLDDGMAGARKFVTRYWSKYLDEVVKPPQDAKTALQEWAQAQGLSPPTYTMEQKKGPDHAPEFVTSVTVEGFEPEQDSGTSKRRAEQAAATRMLIREGVWSDE